MVYVVGLEGGSYGFFGGSLVGGLVAFYVKGFIVFDFYRMGDGWNVFGGFFMVFF